MPPAWPRNIVPYDEGKLRALSTVESVALYEAAQDRPLVEKELSPSQHAIVAELVAAGLLREQDGRFHPTSRHRRDPETDVPGRLEHKRAVLGYALTVIDDTFRSMESRGADATGALGVVTLPETPEVVARATAIIAEAEDHLRALAEEYDGAPAAARFRAMVYVGSVP